MTKQEAQRLLLTSSDPKLLAEAKLTLENLGIIIEEKAPAIENAKSLEQAEEDLEPFDQLVKEEAEKTEEIPVKKNNKRK